MDKIYHDLDLDQLKDIFIIDRDLFRGLSVSLKILHFTVDSNFPVDNDFHYFE